MRYWRILHEAGAQWLNHNAPRLGAALAYYTVLSLAPMLLIAIAICGSIFGKAAVRGQVYWESRNLIGDQGAAVIQQLLQATQKTSGGVVASVLGSIVLFIGASGVFVELRDDLNYIWDVTATNNGGVWGIIRYRIVSFVMVLGTGLLLMASLLFSAAVQAASDHIASRISIPEPVVELTNTAILFFGSALVFALIYKFMPENRVAWNEVLAGSVITAALFAVGKYLIGLYLRRAAIGSAYGAAGSVIVLLVWVYYSSQIFLYGAEVTRAWSRQASSPQD